jgi:long-chain fatty acid transport protein
MMNRSQLRRAAAAAALTVGSLSNGPIAYATEGYFLEGYGTREKGVAGAGVADSRDPLAISINPAGLVDVGEQFTGGLTAFSPDRGYTTSGPGFVAQGSVESGCYSAPHDNPCSKVGELTESMRSATRQEQS